MLSSTFARAGLVILIALFLDKVEVSAMCNLIPGQLGTFRGSSGDINRPFAGPGDIVEIELDPECHGQNQFSATDVVTVVFKPPSGLRRIVILAGDCAALQAERERCEASAPVECPAVDPQIAVDEEGKLRFTFPDTDEFLDGFRDGRTFTGPAAIAVTDVEAPLPCELLGDSCADLVADSFPVKGCVDALFDAGTRCGPELHSVFPHFTALPPPNDYKRLLEENSDRDEILFTIDVAGNILLPMNWNGVLVNPKVPTAARFLRGTTNIPAFPGGDALRVPSREYLDSFTLHGRKLPPIFEPETVLAGDQDPAELALYGTVDAPIDVLRIARRSPAGPVCFGGDDDGQPCCREVGCPPCPSGRCDELFDFNSRLRAGVGPVIIPRGFCEDLATRCEQDADCSRPTRCVTFDLESKHPVPVDALFGSDRLLAVVVAEQTEDLNLNADPDKLDEVVLLVDRDTGQLVPIGQEDDEGEPSDGRAAVRLHQPPFSAPATAVEGDVVAFLESEPLEGDADKNDDGDIFDSILRIYRVVRDSRVDEDRAVELTEGSALAVDAAPMVNGRSVVISDGLVFFRLPEASRCYAVTTTVSVNSAGDVADDISSGSVISADGRYVAFESGASNLDANRPDENGVSDIFVHDRDSNENGVFDEEGGILTIRVSSPATLGFVSSENDPEANGGSGIPAISADGRFVSFRSFANNLVPGDTNVCNGCPVPGCCSDVFLHDRDADENGIFDEPGGVSTERVSIAADGGRDTQASVHSAVSDDGRFVAFSSAAPLVPLEDNGKFDVYVRDRLNGRTTLLSVDSAGRGGSGSNAPSPRPAISSSGRIVAFDSSDRDLVDDPIDTFGGFQILAHDRDPDEDGVFDQPDDPANNMNRVVSIDEAGVPGNIASFVPSLSTDGRFVAFESLADNLVPSDFNAVSDPSFGTLPGRDVFVHDRLRHTTTRVSVDSAGRETGNDFIFDFRKPSISGDGRYVVFESGATQLVSGDDNGKGDIFVHDLVTRMTANLSDVTRDVRSLAPSIARNGGAVTFRRGSEVAVRACDPFDEGAHLKADVVGDMDFADDDLDDTFLGVLDARTPDGVVLLAPAEKVVVSAGVAAFLVPESAAAPGVALNDGDDDTDDLVVHLYRNRGSTVENLRLAAVDVALSSEWLAAIVPDEVPQSTSTAGVAQASSVRAPAGSVRVRSVSPGADWIDLGENGESPAVSGTLLAFLGSEDSGSGSIQRVIRLFDLDRMAAIEVMDEQRLPVAAEDFVLGPTVCLGGPGAGASCTFSGECPESTCAPALVAVRTAEMVREVDLNQDDDFDDEVLQVFDVASRTLINSGQPVLPCEFEACDPRLPYRVGRHTVTFLTLESDQGCEQGEPECIEGSVDLNGNDQAGDFVLQTLVVHSTPSVTRALAAVKAGVCSASGMGCAKDEECQPDGGVCFLPPGRCLADLGTSCDPRSPFSDPCTEGGGTPCQGSCGSGQFCKPDPVDVCCGSCNEARGTCSKDADCGDPDVKCFKSERAVMRAVSPLAQALGGESLLLSAGLCVQETSQGCDEDSECTPGFICRDGLCRREDGTCRNQEDCPPEAACTQDLVIVAATDSDRDEIPDRFDNCELTANPSQDDANGDEIGDACQLAPASPTSTATAIATSTAPEEATPTPLVASPTPVVTPCAGDCDGDGGVTIDELITGVGIALGTQPVEACGAMDVNRDGRVTINELIRAVRSALDGCAAS